LIDLADGVELAWLGRSVATADVVAVLTFPGKSVDAPAVISPRFNSSFPCCRGSRAVRLGVLMAVAFCQMPLPVGHDHDIELGRIVAGGNAGEVMQRHLALFHSGCATQSGWHIHLVPAPFWLGGAAGDSTGAPAPEAEAVPGAPLPAFVTADAFAPALSALDASILPASYSGNRCEVSTSVACQPTVPSAADRVVLLGVMLC